MTAGLIVDRNFQIDGKTVKPERVLAAMQAALPSWIGRTLKCSGNRIVVRELPSAMGRTADDEEEPYVADWKDIHKYMRSASQAGEWRLVSGASVNRLDQDGRVENRLLPDAAEVALRRVRMFQDKTPGAPPIRTEVSLEPASNEPEEKRINGYTGVSEIMDRRLQRLAKETNRSVPLTDNGIVSGAQGIIIAATRRVDLDGTEHLRGDARIGFTLIHELAAHAGVASEAQHNPDADTGWTHGRQDELGASPADAAQKFLRERAKDQLGEFEEDDWFPKDWHAPPDVIARLFGVSLHPPAEPGGAVPPLTRPFPRFRENLRLLNQGLQLQEDLQRRAQLDRNRLQDELRRAMFQRQQDFERQQQWQRSLNTQRAQDQERLRQMLQRTADLGRQLRQDDARRRLEDINRGAERSRLDEIRRRNESFRIQHLMSRPPPRIQLPPSQALAGDRLWGTGQPGRSSPMTFPPMVIERTRNLPHRDNNIQPSPVRTPVYRPTGGLYC